ncbi:MAG: 3-hydroxybutyrate dehydrogenase [Verrucomicrobia bacterium]|nr:3-hydroxybutyrate dehydrogenase [Verrucomicrobiota bacterium]
MASDKTVLITGAGSGIGKATAERFARGGARVIVHDFRDAGRQFAGSLGAAYVDGDLSAFAGINRIAEEALAIGDGKIDILVNNAGFQHIAPVDRFPEETWAGMIQVMLTAPFQLTKAVLPGMKKQRWGRIINIVSMHGLVASPFKSAYVSAKHGLIGLTKATALEVGEDGITVNAVCPAYVRTPLVEAQVADQARIHGIAPEAVIPNVMLQPAAIKRLVEPDEVAEFIWYLSSDLARSITGAALSIDLGWTAR